MNKNISTDYIYCKGTDGISIAYSILKGSKKNPFLIFLHGMGGDAEAWNLVRKKLYLDGFSSLAVDLRGHGLSERPSDESAYDRELFISDIFQIIKKENIQNYVLVGHCLGGMVSIACTAQNPPELSGLVLVNAFAVPPFHSALLKKKLINKPLRRIVSLLPLKNSPSHVDVAQFMGTKDWDFKRIYSDIAHTHLKSYMLNTLTASEFDASLYTNKVKVPTLVVSGLEDSINPPVQSQHLQQSIRGAKIQYIAKGNHLMIWNNAEEVADIIRSFVTTLKA